MTSVKVLDKTIVEATPEDFKSFVDEDEQYEIDKAIFARLPINRTVKNKIIVEHLSELNTPSDDKKKPVKIV